MLKRVDNAHYWTKDMDATVAFYRETLGLTLRMQMGEDWAELNVAGTTVALHGTREGHAPPQEGATIVFEVDDLEGEMNALRGKGVTSKERSKRFRTTADSFPSGIRTATCSDLRARERRTSLMGRRVAMVGAGMTKFVRRAQETGKELAWEAASLALESC